MVAMTPSLRTSKSGLANLNRADFNDCFKSGLKANDFVLNHVISITAACSITLSVRAKQPLNTSTYLFTYLLTNVWLLSSNILYFSVFRYTCKSYIIVVIYYISYNICSICHPLALLACTIKKVLKIRFKSKKYDLNNNLIFLI